MRRNIEVNPYLFPMPTYMIGTYNEDESVDVMMMAWGGICAEDMVALNLEAEHKTVANLKERKAFTLAVPSTDTLKESDFLGIASSNKMKDKFERTGLHAVKGEHVDAPVILEYPLTLECEVVEMQNQSYGLRVLGKIVSITVDEKVLDERGKIDAGKLNAFAFDQMRNGYYAIGEKVGQAWHSGADLMKKVSRNKKDAFHSLLETIRGRKTLSSSFALPSTARNRDEENTLIQAPDQRGL